MPRSSTKALVFPLAGVSRHGAHRTQTRPFSAPWAVNMRTAGPSESRKRGGSRPGLEKLCPTDLGSSITALIPITYIDLAGDRQHDLIYVADGVLGRVRDGVATELIASLATDDGDTIITDDGDTIVFDSTVSVGALQAVVRAGRVYLADTVLRRFDPRTGVVEPVGGSPPSGQPVIAVYRDRIFLSGSNQVWYASRVGNPEDWSPKGAKEDSGRPTAGQLSDGGALGDVITAMVPLHDKTLVLATVSTLWAIRGDPVTGAQENVSDDLGIISANAWAMSPDGLLAFLSHDGIYLWDAGTRAAPVRFSAERLPDELREIDTSTNTVSMTYDSVERGYHVFLTPANGVGTHWWVDAENRAFWPQRLAEIHQPLSAALLTEEGLGDVVIGSQDGFIRKFVEGRANDDGVDLESHVLIGPVRLAADGVRDGLLAEIHGVMEGISNSGTVTWRVITGPSAAEASELALADLNLVLEGLPTVSAFKSGIWTEGRGKVSRPRARGAWLVVWLSSTEAWSYEVVTIVARQLGRLR